MKLIKELSFLIGIFISVFILGNVFASADSVGYDVLDNNGGKSLGGDYILESSLGQLDSGSSAGGDYILNAGYEQGFNAESFIDIGVTPTGDIVMPSVSGFMGGQISDGSADIKVTTDYDGYTLAIKSSTNPAFQCDTSSGCDLTDSFANYTPAGDVGNPDYNWNISDSASEFGYTAKGLDILSKFKFDSTGGTCGSGSSDVASGYCWDALTTSDSNIAAGSGNSIGTTTKIKFRSQVGSAKLQPSGTYKTSVTVTATANS